ncbi:MAG: NAD(P)H-dependent oxidoreductase [Clostridia bacterium]|nr:NAD(P)H-dependent oxidoreductase [Clostridia bacterium]
MKTAVVYYSMSGNTAQTAEKIAAQLDADLYRIAPVKAYPDAGAKKFIWGGKSALMGETPPLQPYVFPAAAYDRVIFGTPVWASCYAPPLRTFIREQAQALQGKTFAAFACQGGSGADKALKKLRITLGIDKFAAVLALNDPKDRPAPENDKRIADFCRLVNEE